MNVEYCPGPGTKRETVVSALKGVWKGGPLPPNVKIAKLTGLSGSEVGHAIGGLRREGRLPPIPSKDDWKASISLAKDSIWPYVRPYAELGMTPTEIATAFQLEGKEKFPIKRIKDSLGKAWRKGKLRRRTPEEISNVCQDKSSFRNVSQLRERVSGWLEVRDILAEQGLQQTPSSRPDWFLLIEFLRVRRKMLVGDKSALSKFSRNLDSQSEETEETLRRLRPCFEVIRDKTPTNSPKTLVPRSEAGEDSLVERS